MVRDVFSLTRGAAVAAVTCAALTFALLSLAGWWVSTHNYITNFHRFHLYIEPQTEYYPTASQVVTLARTLVRRDQVAVIIGGSSVMWGAGMTDTELWSLELQRQLGDNYQVINLGMPSGSPQEFGGIAAQALLKEGYPVVYVADVGSTFGPPDGLFYAYVYWDAFYKGYLLDNPAGQIEIVEVSHKRGLNAPFDELQAENLLASRLYFTDLWNWFGYKMLFTTWNFLVYPPTAEFFTPRGTLADPQQPYPRELRHSSPPFNMALDILRGTVASVCPAHPGDPFYGDPVGNFWAAFDKDAVAVFPDEFKSHVIIARVFESRLYRDALAPTEATCYSDAYARAEAELEKSGYQSRQIGSDWSVDDYIDITHPSPEGGRKMAYVLAQDVRQAARRLGYLDPEDS